MTESIYQRDMSPWPGLETFARRVRLPNNDLALHLYQAGPASATPLLLVHGLGDEADTWRHLIPPLSADHHVLAPDLPGFGRSDAPRRAYTLAFYRDALVELLDELRLDRVTLVGHSLGGLIVHSIALAHPDRVDRLVLIGGSLVSRSQPISLGTILFLIPGIGEWAYNRLRRDPEAAYGTLRAYYGDLDRLPEADRQFLFERVNERVWSDGQRRAFLSTYRQLARSLPALQRGLAARLSQIQIHTQAIWGERDQVNPAENGRALQKLQPDVRLAIVPGAGHNVHQETPDQVLEAIRSADKA